MQAEKLTAIKKELALLNQKELVEITLRLVKYRKENKELITYLLYDADDPMGYAEKVKSSLDAEFENLPKQGYQLLKTLRKILRSLTRHARYAGSREVEIEFNLWFCNQIVNHVPHISANKPLRQLVVKRLEKVRSLTDKLHEDLRFDYSRELESAADLAAGKIRGFSKAEIGL